MSTETDACPLLAARLLPAGALLLLAVSLPCRALDVTGTLGEPSGKVFGLDPVLLSAIVSPENGRRPGSPKADVPGVVDLWRASAVLDLVAGPESRGNYNAWYREAHQQEVQLADLTLGEVRALQARLVRRNGGSAIGRYQIIDETLERLVSTMGLTGRERFTPALQDRMALRLARDAGLDAWLAGALADARFAANLARVWAGLPGDHRGRSVYAGIQGNRAAIGWHTLVASLRRIRSDIISK